MRKTKSQTYVDKAITILEKLGMPKAQQNNRTAMCLLALLDLKPGDKWNQAQNPLMGITPIMDWTKKNYGKEYAPNTRETVRKDSIQPLVEAGIALRNPDQPSRPVNSPKTVYQIETTVLSLIRSFGSRDWDNNLQEYLNNHETLAEHYAMERKQEQIPVQIAEGKKIHISPGEHSELMRDIIEEFGPRFVPGGTVVYVGDTGDKWGYFDKELLTKIGVTVNPHGKMPDVILFDSDKNWLFLIESVTSSGPVSGKRHDELSKLFADSKAGLVYVTAFPNRSTMSRHVGNIAWETEVWVAENPSHLIHFNGSRFLGPYGH